MSRRALLGRGVALSVALATPGVAFGRAAPPWPGGRKGAVSLTYDDGLDSQLDLAVPALNAFGLKATFFVTMQNIRHRLDAWTALRASGHELRITPSATRATSSATPPGTLLRRRSLPWRRG